MNCKKYVWSMVFGALGFTLAWGVWHLNVDHQNLHRLFDLVSQQQQRAAAPRAAQDTATPSP